MGDSSECSSLIEAKETEEETVKEEESIKGDKRRQKETDKFLVVCMLISAPLRKGTLTNCLQQPLFHEPGFLPWPLSLLLLLLLLLLVIV